MDAKDRIKEVERVLRPYGVIAIFPEIIHLRWGVTYLKIKALVEDKVANQFAAQLISHGEMSFQEQTRLALKLLGVKRISGEEQELFGLDEMHRPFNLFLTNNGVTSDHELLEAAVELEPELVLV